MFLLALSIIVNWFVIFALVHLFFSTTNAVLISAGVIVLLVALSLSSVVEAITGYLNDGRRPTRDELERIENALRKIRENVEEIETVNGPIPFVETPIVFVSKVRGKNAFAIGCRSIIITRGLLQDGTDEELAGVLAHEIGHLVHGDSTKRLVQATVSCVGNIAAWLLLVATVFLTYFSQVFGGAGWLIGLAISIVALSMKLVYSIVQWLINMGLLTVGRKEEYAADSYAKSLGCGGGLSCFLKKYHSEECENQKLWATWTRTHPFTEERIKRLDTC
jgi:Zn-dependent protease with chaperone function